MHEDGNAMVIRDENVEMDRRGNEWSLDEVEWGGRKMTMVLVV